MTDSTPQRRLVFLCVGVLVACGTGLTAAGTAAHAQDDVAPFALVGEMERPAGITAQPPSAIRALQRNAVAQAGLPAFRDHMRSLWPTLRAIDVVALSRYHIEATRGWQIPRAPGELEGRVIGLDPDGAHAYLELRGPRLPASFDIVHRHLSFYARYATASGKLDRVTVTIRLQVFE